MAVAIDATSVADATSVSHTCTGANRLLVVGIETSNGGTANGADYVTAVTYNSVAMTRAISAASGADYRLYLYYLVAPATGANTIAVTSSSSLTVIRNASYTGVKQGDQPDATATLASGNPVTVTTTTVLINCWTAGMFRAVNALTADSGCVLRANSGTRALADSNAALSVGANNMVVSNSSGNVGGLAMSFSPSLTYTIAVDDTCTQTENTLKRARSYAVETITLTQITIASIADTVGLSEAYFSLRRGWQNVAKAVSSWINQSKT